LSSVAVTEFHQSRWKNPDESPYLTKLANYQKTLVAKFAHEIVSAYQSKQSAYLLSQLLRLGQKLLEIKNYNSLYAIYLTINLPEISRLTKTWKLVSKRTSPDAINHLFSSKNNYYEYRTQIINSSAPYVPAREIILQDLQYVADSTPNYAGENQSEFNIVKLKKMGLLINSCIRLPQFGFENSPEIQGALSLLYEGRIVAPLGTARLTHEDLIETEMDV